MSEAAANHLQMATDHPILQNGTLVMAFTGWMDGGDVSTGTVERLIDLLEAKPVGEIDPEEFFIFNFPGSMELASLFRPHIEIEGGLVQQVDLPTNQFYCHEPANLMLYVGKEPNMRWRAFRDCIFEFARQTGITRLLFVGSFGGSVPHTRDPRLYVTCSEPELLPEMQRYNLQPTEYAGPGSFTSYLMTQVQSAGLQMASLVAEIPGYLQGTNPLSIEAVTRRLAKILKLPLDLDSLRVTSTQWEMKVSNAVDRNEELAEKVRSLEEEYDDALLERDDTP